jgi:hypothetical protein
MCSAIDNPVGCEIQDGIHFLRAKNMSAVEIHHELYAVYSQSVISERTVRQWCRLFKHGRRNVHDEEQSGQPYVVSDDCVQSVDQKICERWCFTIYELSCEFYTNFRHCPIQDYHS